MTVVKKTPEKLGNHDLCPGCGHGIVLRLIEEVVEELHQENNQIVIAGVGCGCTATPAMHFDRFQAAHGRAAATAEGVKRVRPNVLVFAYQGDGDAYTIGIAESMNAAYRNENITQFVINNVNFGMTGGQMSWTTLPGQKTETSVNGRNCELTGMPFHFPEMVANSKGFHVAYAARGAVIDAKTINQTKRMIRNALEAQLNGEGYSVVEVLSPCPTNWHMSPKQCREQIAGQIMAEYPLGEFKTRG